MKQLPRFDRYLIYFGLSLPVLVVAFFFGLWLGPQVPLQIPLLLILGGVTGLVALRHIVVITAVLSTDSDKDQCHLIKERIRKAVSILLRGKQVIGSLVI